jgi:hypothetical protein
VAHRASGPRWARCGRTVARSLPGGERRDVIQRKSFPFKVCSPGPSVRPHSTCPLTSVSSKAAQEASEPGLQRTDPFIPSQTGLFQSTAK